jgi:hypothetical protein
MPCIGKGTNKSSKMLNNLLDIFQSFNGWVKKACLGKKVGGSAGI